MRKLAALICLFTLAACGPAAAPAGEQPAAQANDGPVVLATTRNMPDWLLVLRTNDGGTIHFNQRTITRENGLADIWLQVRHGRQQLWEADTETTERVIRYDVERVHYRFNCAEETFVVVERQIMGANEQVIARDEPRQIYRRAPYTGAARHILPIACRGG
ncbi:MAG: surface-adhesin E family protein [Hyphomonadaceae bacterium]